MEKIEEILVSWEGPFKINEILNDSIDKRFSVKANDIGLYQIYGFHPLYGDNVLVYIGRTKGRNGFKARLKNRWVIEHGCDTENVQIYLGTIYSDSVEYSKNEIEVKIEKAEILLINALTPAYNSSNIQSVKKEILESRYIVYNNGNYRNLHPVLDSKYFWHEHKNIAFVNKIEKLFSLKMDTQEEYYGTELNGVKEFNIPERYKIWFGVDYEIWDRDNVPLVIEIYSDDDTVMNKIRQIGGLKNFKYESDSPYNHIFYKSVNVDLLSKDDTEISTIFKQTIEEFIQKIVL